MHGPNTNWPPSSDVQPLPDASPTSDQSTTLASASEPPRRRIGSSPALLLRRHSTVNAIDEEDEETNSSTLSTTHQHQSRSDTNNNNEDDPLLQLLLLSDQPSTIDEDVFSHLPSVNDNDVPLKCIFLCEFHATAGPTIAAQVPSGYITKDVFAIVNRYIIPKLQLERSFLSVNLLGHKILGYPVRIDNPQLYARNAFYFNVCFVFEPTTRTVCYEPVVRKLTEYMVNIIYIHKDFLRNPSP